MASNHSVAFIRVNPLQPINGFEHAINLFVYFRLPPVLIPILMAWHSECQGTGVKNFRERGIYLAPNGESFVASRERKTTSDGRRILSRFGNRLSCFLFGRYEWAFHGPPDFEVATTGNLRALKQPSGLNPVKLLLDQLIDTGATAGAH